MELQEFKKLLHGQMQDVLLDTYHDYMEAVKLSDDPEVKRKAVQLHLTTIGAEHKEKVDPGANLPVFNFTFTSAGMTATASLPTIEAETLDNPQISASPDVELATLDFGMLNPAARAALNRDVDFTEDGDDADV